MRVAPVTFPSRKSAVLALSVSQWMLFAGYGLGTWMDLALMIFLAAVAGGFALRMLRAIRE